MKTLLIVTSVLEAGVGVALLCRPSETISLLLGSPLDTPAAIVLGRVAGAALLTLGIANWFAQFDSQSRAARGLVTAMTVYNLGAAAVLALAGLQLSTGLALWPVVILHAGMFAWCIESLVPKPSSKS